MSIRKPLVLNTSGKPRQLPVGDTLSTAILTDSTDKRLLTDAQQALLGQIEIHTSWLYLPQAVLDIDSATIKGRTALGSVGQTTLVVALPNGSTNGVSCSFEVPSDGIDGHAMVVRPIWAPGSTASGSVRWEYTLQRDGLDITDVPTPIGFTGDSASWTINVVSKETGGSSGSIVSTPGCWYRLALRRLGGDAVDTYSGVVNLIGIQIDYSTYGAAYNAGGSIDAFASATISAGGITGFGAARKLYLLGGGTLSGIDATGCVAGTTLECTLANDTALSNTNVTAYAGIAMPYGAPAILELAQYERFSVQLISPSGGSAFWQMRL